jgi:hypothetical protein
LNAPVVEGVSIVVNPITPIFTPDSVENKAYPLWRGRKFYCPASERMFAARFGVLEVLPAQ